MARLNVDTRIQCPHCKARTWSTDYAGFMRDHDRPDGRVCRQAQQAYAGQSELCADESRRLDREIARKAGHRA